MLSYRQQEIDKIYSSTQKKSSVVKVSVTSSGYLRIALAVAHGTGERQVCS